MLMLMVLAILMTDVSQQDNVPLYTGAERRTYRTCDNEEPIYLNKISTTKLTHLLYFTLSRYITRQLQWCSGAVVETHVCHKKVPGLTPPKPRFGYIQFKNSVCVFRLEVLLLMLHILLYSTVQYIDVYFYMFSAQFH